MDEKVKHLLNQLKEQLIKIYGEKIKGVILYGSYVRGEATRDSDIDILVVVDESLNPSYAPLGRLAFATLGAAGA